MIKKVLILIIAITLTSCANIKDNLPKQKTCTDEKAKTLSDIFCKKS